MQDAVHSERKLGLPGFVEFDKSVHAPAEETDFFGEVNGWREEGDELASRAIVTTSGH
jgi:hypothetical protein